MNLFRTPSGMSRRHFMGHMAGSAAVAGTAMSMTRTLHANAETLKRMQRLLLDWREETDDPYLDPGTLAKKHADVNAK